MKALLLSAMVSSMAWGQVSQVEIKDFNFNYQNPLGEGLAQTFSYSTSVKKTEQKVHVEKVNDEFKILLEGTENGELTFQDAPSFVKEAETMELSNFNLILNEKFSLSMSKGNFRSPENEIGLNNLNLNCHKDISYAEVMDQLISGCIQNMSLKTSQFSTDGFSKDSMSAFTRALMKASDEGYNEFLGGVGIKNLNFKSNNGKFELSAEIKAQISGTARGKGNLSYDQSQKKLTVKISEVKFGILNVTSQVFDELKKQESPNFKVSKPYVYMTLE